VDNDSAAVRFDVTCFRTGKTSKIPVGKWTLAYSWKEDSPEIKKGVYVEALIDFAHNGVEYFQKGDKGQVASDVYKGNRGVTRFNVQWERSGKTSNLALSKWPRFIKWVKDAPRKSSKEQQLNSSAPAVELPAAALSRTDFNPLHSTPRGSPRQAKYAVTSTTPRGSPRVVVTSLEDGRRFMTFEPPAMEVMDGKSFGIVESDNDAMGGGCVMCVRE
jgi:hypothetical protein